MVRVAGLMRQAALRHAPMRSPDGLTPQRDAGADPRARARAHARAVAAVARGAEAGARARTGSCVGTLRGLHGGRAGRARPSSSTGSSIRCSRRSPSGPASRSRTSPGSRSRSAVRPRPGDGRGAVRARQGAGDAAALRARSATRGLLLPVEEVIGHFLPWLFPGMEIGERAVFRVTRDADFEVSDEADDLLEAVELEVRRRRFGEVVRLEVSSSMSRADARAPAGGPGRRRRSGLPDRRACSISPT